MAIHKLISIAYSHYNEQARWVLDHFSVPYREKAYLPILHFLPVMLATLGRGVGKADSVSTRFSTPLLITDSGRRIADSREIMRYVSDRFSKAETNLYPHEEVQRLQNQFHDQLGPATRRIVYYYLLPDQKFSDELVKNTVSYPQWLISKIFGKIAAKTIAQKLNVNSKSVLRAVETVQREFDQVGKRLQNRKYLSGDRLSAADISFACLACPALWITKADGHPVIPEQKHPLPKPLADLARKLRQTEAGKFALRMFREERGTR